LDRLCVDKAKQKRFRRVLQIERNNIVNRIPKEFVLSVHISRFFRVCSEPIFLDRAIYTIGSEWERGESQ